MATANLELSISSHDYLGIHVSNVYYFTADDTTTLAHAISDATELVVLQDDLSGCKIDKCQLSVNFMPSSLKSTPTANDEAEMTALFNFAQAGSVYKFGVDVPGIIASAIYQGKVDLGSSAVSAFVAWLVGTHTYLTSVSKFLLALTSVLDALISFRKHRSQEQRRSIAVP